MLLLLVPELKSSLSTTATFKPLVAASSAIPEPVAPPPMTNKSYGSSPDSDVPSDEPAVDEEDNKLVSPALVLPLTLLASVPALRLKF